ncbi:MAG TPA: MASE3 domain-containing protein [Pseudobacteroides sp.]|uniref:MASE3 domain-containing protein n=1 Tax=Pseudobacteroides sp. TaxID=1968840 RepID=UPI002F95E19C
MGTEQNDRLNSKVSIKTLIIQYLFTVAGSILFAVVLHTVLIKYLDIYHSALELSCVFISISTFFAAWFTYNNGTTGIYILGFGYLAVALFDALHTLFYFKLNLNSHSFFDLSTWYWVLGRFAEAVILLLSVQSFRIRLNKWLALCITLIIASGVSVFCIVYHDYLPILLTEQGITQVKLIMEIVIMSILMLAVYFTKNKVSGTGIVTYKYIFVSLILTISAEFCFVLYITVESTIWTIGHVLKIASYFYLFKGIYISTVTYPYENLEDEHIKLDNAYKKLDEAHIQIKTITENLNSTLDALPIAVLKCGFDRRIIYVNRMFEDVLACDRNKLYGYFLEDVLKEFGGERQDEKFLLDELINNKVEGNQIMWICQTGRGDIVKLSVTAQRIGSGILVLIKDAKREQELENVHLQTQTILNAISNSVLMIDKHRKIILHNKALEEVFEIEDKRIKGMDLDELNKLVDFDCDNFFDMALRGIEDKQYHEIAVKSMKGNRKELLMYFTPIKNIEGEIIGGISVGTDITEIRKEQQKMIQQEKLALLGQMGAGIVHETRNYLTTIKGRCQLIDMLSHDKTIKGHTAKIKSNIEEVNKIISEFLFLSKPREAQMEEVSLCDVFKSIKAMIEASSLVKGVDIDFNLSNEERYLYCDESQLKQVMLNICKNAIDAMAEVESAKLKIDTGYNEQTNEMVIQISDNGKGISKEDLKKIGTPFFTTKKSGTGLGLNVCHQIIKQHSGNIDVQSELGKGTTFTITLPCIEDDEEFEAV